MEEIDYYSLQNVFLKPQKKIHILISIKWEDIQRWNSHILRVWTIYGTSSIYWFPIVQWSRSSAVKVTAAAAVLWAVAEYVRIIVILTYSTTKYQTMLSLLSSGDFLGLLLFFGEYLSNSLKPVRPFVLLPGKITFGPEGPFNPPQDLEEAPRREAELSSTQ